MGNTRETEELNVERRQYVMNTGRETKRGALLRSRNPKRDRNNRKGGDANVEEEKERSRLKFLEMLDW